MKHFSLIFITFLFITTLNFTADAGYKLEKLANWTDPSIEPFGNQSYNDVWGYVDSAGREYAILGSVDGFYFIDVTDPENPEVIQKITGRHKSAINRDFHTYKHYAYAVADQGPSALKIIDLQYLPDSVHVVYDNDSIVMRTHNSFIENDRMYLASHSAPNQFYPMSVLSLENPEVPVLLGHLHPPTSNGRPMFDHVHDVHVRNDTAYCSNGFDGLFIYDYKDPASPVLISVKSNYPNKGYNHSGWLNEAGNRFVFADETHGAALKYYDVTNIRDPQLLDIFGLYSEEGSIAHNPFIHDSLIFVSYYHNGIVVFDKSNPNEIRKIASYDTYPDNIGEDGKRSFNSFQGAWGVYPFLPSGTILGSDMTYGLFTLKLVEDPEASIENRNQKDQAVKIYPNPFAGSLNISMQAPDLQNVEITISDLAGRTIKPEKIQEENSNQFNVTFPNSASPGIYIVHLKTNGQVYTRKVVKQ